MVEISTALIKNVPHTRKHNEEKKKHLKNINCYY